MSSSAIKSPFCKAYDEIKDVVNDANRQIRNFNLKTIAKIIALVAIFTLGGGFSALACMKMGVATELLGLPVLPFMIAGMYFIRDFTDKNIAKMSRFIKNINEDMKTKLKHSPCIKQAVSLNNLENDGWFTVPKIEIDSYDRTKTRYEKDFRRHLPGFLQFSKPSNENLILGSSLALLGTVTAAVMMHKPNFKA